MPADDNRRLCFEWRQEERAGLYKKGKIRVKLLLKLESFLLLQEL
jgi:hypothetical protein